MAMSVEDAAVQADTMLRFILQHQPQLFASNNPGPHSGKHYAEAISALREGLIAMYQTQP